MPLNFNLLFVGSSTTKQVKYLVVAVETEKNLQHSGIRVLTRKHSGETNNKSKRSGIWRQELDKSAALNHQLKAGHANF